MNQARHSAGLLHVRVILMTTNIVTRRAALAGLAALAPATGAAGLPADSGDDPFLVALAKLREACAARDAESWEAKGDDEYDEDHWQVLHARSWDAFRNAIETSPTTIEGRYAVGFPGRRASMPSRGHGVAGNASFSW
jgi:hypothetical protein